MCVWREEAVVGGLRVRTVLVCTALFSERDGSCVLRSAHNSPVIIIEPVGLTACE